MHDFPAWLAEGPPGWYSVLSNPLFMLVPLLLILYIFVIRAKSKQDKERRQMIENLKKGDRVQTIGGILGTVVETREHEVLLKVDESANTKIRFTRNAIHRVIEDEKSPEKK